MKNKIKKIIKWLLIIFFVLIVILFIILYISSLGAYKQSDFNIDKNFFQTKYSDKNAESKENWFQDFIILENKLESKRDFLRYFEIKSKCIFNEKYIKKWQCEKDIEKELNKIKKEFNKIKKEFILEDILKSKLVNLKIFIYSINKDFENLNKKKFFKKTKEYYSDSNWNSKIINYSWLFQYFHVIKYMAYNYFEEWKYEKWIDLLLKSQTFIDNYLNKADFDLIWFLVWISISKNNLEALQYFIDNYELDTNLKEKIKLVLTKKIETWLIETGLKNDHFSMKKTIKNFKGYSDYNDWYIDYVYRVVKWYLFFSAEETELMLDKYMYEVIKNKWKILWKPNKKIYNFIWRKIVFNAIWANTYSRQFEEEEELWKLRKKILKKLEKN